MYNTEEYQSLRQEILDSFNREVNLTALVFTATAAIIGYGFSTSIPNPDFFLIPLPILGLLLLQLNNSIYTILTISVYIRVFVECDSKNHNWETVIYKLRNYFRQQKRFNPLRFFAELHYAFATSLFGGLCILLYFSYDNSDLKYPVSILAALLWIPFCLIMLRPIIHVNSGNYEQELQLACKQAKEEIANSKKIN